MPLNVSTRSLPPRAAPLASGSFSLTVLSEHVFVSGSESSSAGVNVKRSSSLNFVSCLPPDVRVNPEIQEEVPLNVVPSFGPKGASHSFSSC